MDSNRKQWSAARFGFGSGRVDFGLESGEGLGLRSVYRAEFYELAALVNSTGASPFLIRSSLASLVATQVKPHSRRSAIVARLRSLGFLRCTSCRRLSQSPPLPAVYRLSVASPLAQLSSPLVPLTRPAFAIGMLFH